MNIFGLSFALFLLKLSPGKDFWKHLTEDFFTILEISVFKNFWNYVGHLRVELKLQLFPITHIKAWKACALIKFYSPSYCLGMPAEVKTHKIRHFQSIWLTKSIDLLQLFSFFYVTFIGSLKLGNFKNDWMFLLVKSSPFFNLRKLFIEEIS